MIDTGRYNRDKRGYKKLVEELYGEYRGGITLPPEYAYFIRENLLQFLIRLARYKFIARLLKNNDCVLEVGSGSGLGCIFLSQHCARATGIEVKKTEVEEACSINRRKNVDFITGDFLKSKELKSYDCIVALDVIEHMDKITGFKLLKKISRHLKPSGMAIIGTPSRYSYPYQSKLSRASHVKCYDQQELLFLMDSCFGRSIAFSMNDEVVHTGFPKMAWYYFILGFMPKGRKA